MNTLTRLLSAALIPLTLLGCESPALAEDGPAAANTTAVTPEVDTLLDKIEAAAADLKTLKADLRYDRVQGLLGDEQRRFGEFRYDAGPPAKFDARFDKLLVDGAARKIDLRYTFDGVWLAERDGEDKTFTRRQMVEADDKGKPMKLGESPFVLPLDAKKADILARFAVELIEPSPEDPENTLHVTLIPLPGVRMDQTRIDIWYDTESLLPRRVATIDESQNTSIIDLMKVQTNRDLPDKNFDTSAPRGGGWDVQVVPLEEGE
ncbi:MAG: hypothetical protein GVY24_01200 [Planctomycetes bacterium]|jgi:hypothetical protein|nr:hypothetical protein [Planctomycetota bacterium]